MILPIRIGLAQNNMDKLHDILMDVSDPDSEAFAKHLSAEEVLHSLESEDSLVYQYLNNRLEGSFDVCAS